MWKSVKAPDWLSLFKLWWWPVAISGSLNFNINHRRHTVKLERIPEITHRERDAEKRWEQLEGYTGVPSSQQPVCRVFPLCAESNTHIQSWNHVLWSKELSNHFYFTSCVLSLDRTEKKLYMQFVAKLLYFLKQKSKLTLTTATASMMGWFQTHALHPNRIRHTMNDTVRQA